MKKISFITSIIFSLFNGFAQNVGIGTTTPTAQLHTTGTVRHAVLSGVGFRPVFTDANGNLQATAPALPPSSLTNGNAAGIPDFSCTGAASNNTFAGLPVSVQSASIIVTINITHPRLADLSIYLIAPGGAIINLAAPPASLAGANFNNTIFKDSAAALSSGAAPYAGSFKPYGDLNPSICGLTPTASTFAAIGGGTVNPNGAWTLRVIDNTASNTGTLNSWTISVVSGLGVDGVWSLKGNAGTNAFNFIGTTDNVALRFRVRNVNAGIIDSTGNNTAIGYRALDSITTGFYNTAYGNNALKRNKAASYNVALGMSSLQNHLSGDNNTVVGAYALYFNQSTGRDNAVLGMAAMLNSTSGSYNTAVGSATLVQNQSGSYNTAVGNNALLGINANASVAVGASALGQSAQASYLVAVGDSALYNNTGNVNTAVGSKALFSNTDGSSNSAHGFHALYSNLGGNWNTAVGTNALAANTAGFNNTSVGSYSLLSNTTGNQNAALGSDALHENSDGSLNTAIGHASMYNNISGSSNTALGTNALSNVSSGSSNTAIGAGADIFNASFSNATAIGANAIAPLSNSIKLGDNNVTNIYTNNNANVWVGELFVKSNGIVRNTSNLQLKMSSGSYVVSGTINALSTIQVPINFNQTFSTLPVAYVGNIIGGTGGFAEVIMSIANVTTTGATLFVSNPRNSQMAPNFTVNVVAIGGE